MKPSATGPADSSPSKSARKRDSEALQALGEQLVELPEDVLDTLELPERLRDALRLARTITQRSALRRQRQYIGKLMRDIDPAPIRAALERRAQRDRATVAIGHSAERWRTRLIDEGDAALAELLLQHPRADRSRLRELRRVALAEPDGVRGRRAYRELYRCVRDLLSEEVTGGHDRGG